MRSFWLYKWFPKPMTIPLRRTRVGDMGDGRVSIGIMACREMNHETWYSWTWSVSLNQNL